MRINSFTKKLLIGFIPAMVLLATISYLSYKTIKNLEIADNWVSHTLQVIGKTYHISSKLTNAEDKQSLYLLTGNKSRLDEYNLAIKSITAKLYELRHLASDNPSQVKKIDTLIKYSHLKLNRMNLLVALKKKGDLQIIHSIFMQASADRVTNQCKLTVDEIVNAEQKLLVIRKSLSHQKADSAVKLILAYGSISIAVLSILLSFIIRAFAEKKRLREKLQVSESKFSNAFKDSGIGMALVSLEGNWLEVNPYLSQLLGYTPEELLKTTFQEITYPEDLDKDLQLLSSLLRGEIETYKMEKRYIHKHGGIIWIQLTVSLIDNEDGSPGFLVSQIEDITERKKLVNELEIKNQTLSQTFEDLKSKISQLEEFNRIVAHNLRGPAGSIEMMLNMLKEEESAEEKAELIELVSGSSKSLNATLQDLMQVLEIRLNHAIEHDACDLDSIALTTQQMLQGEILRSKALISTEFNVKKVKFPKIYLESVFYNIISNSLKYRKADEPVRISIHSEEFNGKTKLEFQDNGLGIDLKQHGKNMFKLNKVFHKGFDSKGVGLFITKNQLETHGGSIVVESEPNAGSKFIIYL